MRIVKFIFGVAVLGVVFILWVTSNNEKSGHAGNATAVEEPVPDLPQHVANSDHLDKPFTPDSTEKQETAPKPDISRDHELRLLPNLSGSGATEDGRVYSVALIVATSGIPLMTQLLTQGRVVRFGYAGMQSRPFAIVEDEQQSGKTLVCAMTEDEGAEVVSLYHVGEAVQMSGDYMGVLALAGNPSMPILSHCQVAGSQNDVVRPTEVAQ